MSLQECVMTQVQDPASRKSLYEKMIGTVVAAAPRAVTSGERPTLGPFFYMCSSCFLDGTSVDLFNVLKWLP